MVICAEEFKSVLDAKQFQYSVKETPKGDVCIGVPYSQGVMINVIFDADDNGTHVAFRTVFENCPDDRISDMLVICNELNIKYRWVKFCIDKDNDIMLEDDAIVSPETAGEECFELVIRTANIMQDVKPTIMRGLYA